MSNIKRPSFTDRDVQYPNRVTLLPSEGSAVTYDVVPAPGTVTQEGTPVDSDLMNEMADYSELGYKNKLYVSANGHADDVFYETGEPSTVNIYGQTRQNLWKNPSGTSNGVTVTSNEDGSMTVSGTSSGSVNIFISSLRNLAPGKAYTAYIDKAIEGVSGDSTSGLYVQSYNGSSWTNLAFIGNSSLKSVFTVPSDSTLTSRTFTCSSGLTVSGTYRVMLREATEEEIAAAQQTASTLQEGGTADLPQDIPSDTPTVLPAYPEEDAGDVPSDFPMLLPAYPDMLADGSSFDWCPPGLTSVSELTLNVGEEYGMPTTSTQIDLQGNVLSSLPDGTRDVLTVDANGARSIQSEIDVLEIDGSESWKDYQTTLTGLFGLSVKGELIYPQNPLCNAYPQSSSYEDFSCGIDQYGNLWIRDSRYTLLSEFKAYLQTAGIKFLAKRQAPQTVELGNINPVIPPSTTTNMWVSANSTLTPELDFTYDKRLSLGSNTTFGFVKGDGTTIDVINGVIQLAGDVISGIWDKVKPYADATYALINHTHTASQLPKATTSALGLVKPDGSTLSIDGNGTLSVAGGGSGYTLPPATTTTLGGIKVGDNLTVESDGTLNATGGGGSIPNPLPIAQGGTGAQTAAAAEYNILGSPNASSNAIGDSDKLAVVYASPSASNGVLYTQTASKLWTYIKSKADSVYRAATAKIPWADLEDVPASFPPSAHTHSANDITSGTLPIARGGTGGATADAALTNLGVKGTTSGNVTEHYKLGKLHFVRITGTVASLANNQTTVGPFNLGFNMPTQPSGASAVSFTQGTLLSRYTSNAKATVNTLSYISRSSISINLFAQQAISTSVTYDVWLAVSEA